MIQIWKRKIENFHEKMRENESFPWEQCNSAQVYNSFPPKNYSTQLYNSFPYVTLFGLACFSMENFI